jgi:branched-subunit amino acid aminotransferase/4-amino-4-deoxychorismate lyase
VKNGTLITPATGVLKGITRKYVLQVAREFMPVEEREVWLEELWESEEIFITGTSKHVAPVVEIGGNIIGKGRPENYTGLISEYFEKYFGLL